MLWQLNAIPDRLEPEEIMFYEEFIAAGNTVILIPKSKEVPPKSTNDFVWTNNNHLLIELKSPKVLRYSTIKTLINDAVTKAQIHGVIKENFIINLGGKHMSAKLRSQLVLYNRRNPTATITRLWTWNSTGIEELKLIE